MSEIKITLIGDGSSDKILTIVSKWVLDNKFPQLHTSISFADFRQLKNPPDKSNIQKQIEFAKRYYPFDLLIYHRDAETTDINMVETRKKEVLEQIEEKHKNIVICVIPVKMMETWLLINKEAIKKAAGNRNFKEKIDLPSINCLEKTPNPKDKLIEILKTVSGLTGRKLSKFKAHQAVHYVAENISDYSVLRKLNAFRIFENDLKGAIQNLLTTHNL
ncbi:MAG: DUF4276 family protein [Limnohabitans sp.]|nr:DUF4276 family protein [Limnohabitans sp.]